MFLFVAVAVLHLPSRIVKLSAFSQPIFFFAHSHHHIVDFCAVSCARLIGRPTLTPCPILVGLFAWLRRNPRILSAQPSKHRERVRTMSRMHWTCKSLPPTFPLIFRIEFFLRYRLHLCASNHYFFVFLTVAGAANFHVFLKSPYLATRRALRSVTT